MTARNLLLLLLGFLGLGALGGGGALVLSPSGQLLAMPLVLLAPVMRITSPMMPFSIIIS